MLLDGKKLMITGVLTPQSIAFAAATSAQEHGAEIVLTNFGRALSLTQKVAKRLPQPCDVRLRRYGSLGHIRVRPARHGRGPDDDPGVPGDQLRLP